MWKMIGVSATLVGFIFVVAYVLYLVFKEDREVKEAAVKAYREAYEYATSDQGIKDAAKRHAKFLKQVQKELRKKGEKEPQKEILKQREG